MTTTKKETQQKTIEINPNYIDINNLIIGLPDGCGLKYHAIKFAMDKTAARVKFDKQKVAHDYYATVTVPLRARVNMPIITSNFKDALKGIQRIKENLAASERFFKQLAELVKGSTASGVIEAGMQLPTVRLSYITLKTETGVLLKFKHRSEAGIRSALILEEVTFVNSAARNVTSLTEKELKDCAVMLDGLYYTECKWTNGIRGFSCGAGAKLDKILQEQDIEN